MAWCALRLPEPHDDPGMGPVPFLLTDLSPSSLLWSLSRNYWERRRCRGFLLHTGDLWDVSTLLWEPGPATGRLGKAATDLAPHGFHMLLLLLSRFSRVRLCATPQTAAHQAPPSLGFSTQEHWSWLPFPSPMHESGKWKVKVKLLSRVWLFSDPMDCSPPGSSAHGIL